MVNNNLKKKPKDFMQLEKEFFENAKAKHLSMNLCNYVWKVLISTQKGYGLHLLDPIYSNVYCKNSRNCGELLRA